MRNKKYEAQLTRLYYVFSAVLFWALNLQLGHSYDNKFRIHRSFFVVSSVLFDVSIYTKRYKSTCLLDLGIPQWCNLTNETLPARFDCFFARINGLPSFIRRVSKISKSDYYLRHVCPSVCPPAWNNSAHSGRISIKLDIWLFFENQSRKFKFYLNQTRITSILHED
jgi:hypothetical protein